MLTAGEALAWRVVYRGAEKPRKCLVSDEGTCQLVVKLTVLLPENDAVKW